MHHANISYLWTYDLYGPVRNGGFYAGRSITRASGGWALGGPKKLKLALLYLIFRGLSHQTVWAALSSENKSQHFSRAEKPSEEIQ